MEFLKNNKLFSFQYGDKNFWDLPMEVKISENGSEIIFEYLLSDGLKITNKAKKYSEYDAYEWVLWFENTGDKPSEIINNLNDSDITLPFAHDDPRGYSAYIRNPENNMKIYSYSGSQWETDEFYCDIDKLFSNEFINHIFPGDTKVHKTSGGRSSQAKAPYFNIYRQNKGVIFAVGWTGQWMCTIRRGEDDVNIKTKIEDTHFYLLPGEKIRTSSFVMMNYEGSYIESQNKWRRLVKEHFSLIGQPGRSKNVPFCASIWGGMNSGEVIKRINTIRENKIPFEYIWMDAGWYGDSIHECIDEFEGDWASHTGNWKVNETYHPDGLLKVTKAIKDSGLKFVLWFEPERVIYSTPIAAEHPEYFIGSPYENDTNLLLDLGNQNAWQYCFDMLCEKIETLQIDCYRQDFNFDPLEFWQSRDSRDRRGITEIKHINGLYRLWDSLLERFPNLLIDNCASGGRRLDIEMMRRSVPLWRSDVQCPANWPVETAQTHNITFGAHFPYSGTGSGREWGDVYRIRSAYAGGLTTNYTFSERDDFGKDPKQIEWIKKYAEEYLRVRPYFYGDIYPLTDASAGSSAWIAVQYNRPEEKDGIVQIFKRKNSPYIASAFKLCALNPEKIYEFTDADGGDTFELSGRELSEKGFNAEIKVQRVAKIYFYKEK